MSDPIAHQTQDTSSGTSDKNTKTRLKKKEGKIREIEATVKPNGKIVYEDEETGEEKTYIVDSMEDYRWALSEAQTMQKKAIEVSERLFKSLTQNKETPYIIIGNPPVFVYQAGTMEKAQQLDGLTVDELSDLKARKARKEAEAKQAEKTKLRESLGL